MMEASRPGPQRDRALGVQRADLGHHLGPLHQQIVQRVVHAVDLRAERSQGVRAVSGASGAVWADWLDIVHGILAGKRRQ